MSDTGVKILVSTRRSQGWRENDFCWLPDGEPVSLGFVCAADEEHVDGPCGCARSFDGMASHKSTTTAEVVEAPITPEQFKSVVRDHIIRCGFGEATAESHGPEWSQRILDFCQDKELGTVVELRHEGMVVRNV